MYEQQYLNAYSAGNCSVAMSLGDEWATALNSPFLNTVRLVRMHAAPSLPSSAHAGTMTIVLTRGPACTQRQSVQSVHSQHHAASKLMYM